MVIDINNYQFIINRIKPQYLKLQIMKINKEKIIIVRIEKSSRLSNLKRLICYSIMTA